jgi:hypothetical protein
MIRAWKAFLNADGVIAGIVDGRIYPNKVPKGGLAPAVTYQLIGGHAENYLAEGATMDRGVYQMSCWALDMTTCDALANAVRRMVETTGYVVAYHGSDIDEDTGWTGIRFDVSVWDSR